MTTMQVTDSAQASGDSTAGDLRTILAELSGRFLEREGVTRALLQTVLAGQHALLLGPPGTAKSDLVRALTSRFTGATYFELLLSKFTDPKKVFGPLDVAGLIQGEYRQMLERGATGAHIVFLDEVFKCGDGALNDTLAYLNERIYHPESGGAPIQCPLISAITASNELPTGDGMGAIYDRLLVRIEVDYLADPANFVALLRSGARRGTQSTPTTVPLEELLRAVEEAVPAVDVPDGVLDRMCELRTALRRRELITSDRRWKQAVGLVQAGAWLAGRRAAQVGDLSVLTHVLWDSPSERRNVEREVLQLVDPDALEVLYQLDGLADVESALDAKAGESDRALNEWAVKEASGKLTRAGRLLSEIRSRAEAAGRSLETVDRALREQRRVQTRVYVEALGLDANALSGQA